MKDTNGESRHWRRALSAHAYYFLARIGVYPESFHFGASEDTPKTPFQRSAEIGESISGGAPDSEMNATEPLHEEGKDA